MDIMRLPTTLLERKTVLSVTAFIAIPIGLFILVAPQFFLESVKHAEPNDTANVMARTAGILLISIGLLDFLVRNSSDSPTMLAILAANLVLQIGIMPIDVIAYVTGAFSTLGSFVPNTIAHVILASGYAYQIRCMRRQTWHPI